LYGRTDIEHYRSPKEVVEDQDVDLVLLLPIEAMPDAIKLFLNSRKHVISEKPCAPSIASGIELMELMLGSNDHRFGPSPRIGVLRRLSKSSQCAGGVLLDSGVHFVAPLRKVVGEIEKVSGSVSQRLPAQLGSCANRHRQAFHSGHGRSLGARGAVKIVIAGARAAPH
jgi:predicted dehydrogenase